MAWLQFATLVALTSMPVAQPAATDRPGATRAGEAKLAEANHLLWDADNTEPNLRASLRAFDVALQLGLPSADEQATAHAYKAFAYLRLGDLLKGDDEKMATYIRGRQEADAGLVLNPRNAEAHFYHCANVGRWAQTNGLWKSLFMLGDIKKEFELTVALNPNHIDARLALGKIDEELPGMMGGSWERAEAAYRKALEIDPHFTRSMLELGELLSKHGKSAEAITWATRARDETTPTRVGEWRKFDRERATRLLGRIDHQDR